MQRHRDSTATVILHRDGHDGTGHRTHSPRSQGPLNHQRHSQAFRTYAAHIDIQAFNDRRARLNRRLADVDGFFAAFSDLDSDAYADGTLPAQTKELIGIALSVCSRCDECVAHHVQSAQALGVKAAEAHEAVKLGVVAAGSVAYPTARNAVELIDQLLV